MKSKFTFVLAMLIGAVCFAQNGINYKAVIKDGNGDIIANDLIAVQFSIRYATAVGAIVYQEDHAPTTDANGLIAINIGEGNPINGVFANLNWSLAPHFLNVQINTGAGFINMGTTEFKAVPYALSAPDTSKWTQLGNNINRQTGNIGIGTANPSRKLHMVNDDEDISVFLQNGYTGASSKYGIYNYLTEDGTGTRYGIYNNLDNDNASSTTYGIYNTMSTTGSSSNNYGLYSYIASSGTGIHYAVYGYAAGPGNYGIYGYNNSSLGWAGFFSGRTKVTDRLIVGASTQGATGLVVNDKDFYIRRADTITVRGRYSGAGTGGEIELYMASGFRTLELQASETATTGAQIKLYKDNGTLGIELDADFLGFSKIITQQIEVTGSDIAEKFKIAPSNISGTIRPGVLLSIDTENPGSMVMTNEAYDKKIAGIISGANGVHPGVLMGGAMSDEVEMIDAGPSDEFPIALAGKAYVYANTENGPIEIGDLLTSSSTPGYAMKVNDYSRAQGAIIGKAMTALNAGNGFVLVLVSLN